MFDEYTEEVNNTVSYGVLYTKRLLTDSFNRDTMSQEDEEKLTLALKMDALVSIKDDCNQEYSLLLEQYNKIVGVVDGSM